MHDREDKEVTAFVRASYGPLLRTAFLLCGDRGKPRTWSRRPWPRRLWRGLACNAQKASITTFSAFSSIPS